MLREADLDEPFARGATATLHHLPDGRVLKLFTDATPAQAVQREATIGRIVTELGLPVPRSWPVERVGLRLAIPMERVDGATLAEHIFAAPDDAEDEAERLAAVHARIAACAHLDLRPGRAAHRSMLETVDVDEATRTRLLTRHQDLAGDTRLCHGDLHAGNVLRRTDGELRVIDWGAAHAGSPASDAAQTVVAMTEWLSMDLPADWKATTDRFVAAYRSARTDVDDAVEAWLPVIAAIRLASPHPSTSDAPLRALIALA